MSYQINIETCWLLGIWAADKGSLAKGVVSLNNKTEELLSSFERLSLNNFDIDQSRIRKRNILSGYGKSKEVYFTRLPARKFLEKLVNNRYELNGENAYAYFAGRLDGDGSIDSKGSILCYYYGKKEIDEMKIDAELIKKLGFFVSVGTCGKKALRLRVLKPRFFGSKILKYVKHPEKRKNLKIILNKRRYEV